MPNWNLSVRFYYVAGCVHLLRLQSPQLNETNPSSSIPKTHGEWTLQRIHDKSYQQTSELFWETFWLFCSSWPQLHLGSYFPGLPSFPPNSSSPNPPPLPTPPHPTPVACRLSLLTWFFFWWGGGNWSKSNRIIRFYPALWAINQHCMVGKKMYKEYLLS